MTPTSDANFKHNYQTHLKHLRLKGLQPKTIDAYARAIRRIGTYFDYQIDDLSEAQLTDYFTAVLDSQSWSVVKHDLYGLKFYYAHVLHKPWATNLVKPPKIQRLPDIVTVDEAKRLFMATRILSYRVFYFTVYSLGLRLGEGLRLQVGDIDAGYQRVHIRNSKGNKDTCTGEVKVRPGPGCGPTNRPPVARCKDRNRKARNFPKCEVYSSIDNGSFDPDGDSISKTQLPEPPYGIGTTTVTLTVTDSKGASDTCTGKVKAVHAILR